MQVIGGQQGGAGRGHAVAGRPDGLGLRHPAVVAVEVGWRWLFGIPFLLVLWTRRSIPRCPDAGRIRPDQHQLAKSLAGSGATGGAWWQYEPLVAHELRWLAPVAVLVWIVISGLGRNLH